MATIKDVARRAGLSKTLVSRYLNGVRGVSPESRERIRAAIDELNYRPSGIARSLASQKTHTIGVVVDDLRSPFLFELIAGLERGAEEFDREEKYNVVFCNSNGDIQRKQRHINFLTQGRVDGVIIYGSFVRDDPLIGRLAADGFPFLLIENDLADVDASRIVFDNLGGARRAVEHLIGLGHREIVHIGGSPELGITRDRLQGYLSALQAHGLPVRDELILFPDFLNAPDESPGQKLYFDRGYETMKKLLAGGPPPGAIFFATDLLAFGAIKALGEAGLRVPQDVSLVGFDDENPAFFDFVAPRITTVRVPLAEAGYRGIQTLLAGIERPGQPRERIVLETGLVLRDSTQRKAA
jgi:LacI family transcriptional regulator